MYLTILLQTFTAFEPVKEKGFVLQVNAYWLLLLLLWFIAIIILYLIFRKTWPIIKLVAFSVLISIVAYILISLYVRFIFQYL